MKNFLLGLTYIIAVGTIFAISDKLLDVDFTTDTSRIAGIIHTAIRLIAGGGLFWILFGRGK